MTNIDFYIMEAAEAQAPRFAAKLALEAFRQHKRIHIHNHDEASNATFSDLLWGFSQSSFMAHGNDAKNTITLGFGEKVEPNCHDQLIVLSNKIPPCFSRFERLAVVVPQDEAAKTVAREQFRYFKQRGYPLNFKAIKHSNF